MADEGGRVGVFGRFQPLHRGHAALVRACRDRGSTVVVVLGSPAAARTAENPLAAGEREAVVRACFPDVDVVRVADAERGTKTWARRLEARADVAALLTRDDRVRGPVRAHTDVAIREPTLREPERFSGTEVRRRIREGDPWRPLVPDRAEARIADFAPAIARTG